MQYKFHKLSNGLMLILQPIHSFNSVVVSAAIGSSPRYETKETSGLAHFLEHMLFEGTERFPSSRDVAEYIERLGGRSGAWTNKEYVNYYVKIPKQHLNTGLDYLSEIFFHSLLKPEAIEREKGIVMEEIKRKRDNPEIEVWDLWLEWIWSRSQSLGRSTLGDDTTVKGITKEKLQAYIDNLYHPANMAIAIVGNFIPSEAKKYVVKYFGKRESKSIPEFKSLAFTPKKVHTRLVKANTEQTQLILGFVTNVSYHHRDRFTLRVIADILSGGVSSRLFHKLVYELGLAYSAGAGSWIFADVGLFYTYGGFAPQNIEKAVKLILGELEKIKREKVTSKELREAKVKDKVQLYFSLETPDAIAHFYATQQIAEKQIMTPGEIAKRIDNVTVEEVQRIAREYFIAKNLCLTIRGNVNENDVNRIETLLTRIS